MPKFNKSTGYKMKGFSGFYDSPLKDSTASYTLPEVTVHGGDSGSYGTVAPPTSYLSTQITNSNLAENPSEDENISRPDYTKLIKAGEKTGKTDYMSYRKFREKTKGVEGYGPDKSLFITDKAKNLASKQGATREQYKDWKQEHGFKSGLVENLKKVDPSIWESMIQGAAGPVMHALLREKEKAPHQKFASTAEGFSKIQIGTGQKI